MGSRTSNVNPKFPNGANNGYVWTSDASGNGSWQAAGGGGGGGFVGQVVTTTQTFANTSTKVLDYLPPTTTAGSTYEFKIHIQLVNTTATTTYTTAVWMGGVTSTMNATSPATGTTARSSPGGTLEIVGHLTFLSSTQVEGMIRQLCGTGVAFFATGGTTAPVTFTAGGSIQIFCNSGAATATSTRRETVVNQIA